LKEPMRDETILAQSKNKGKTKETMQVIVIISILVLVIVLAIILAVMMIKSSQSILSPSPWKPIPNTHYLFLTENIATIKYAKVILFCWWKWKGKLKWRQIKKEQGREYVNKILSDERFRKHLVFSVYRNIKDYDLLTMMSIAKAINTKIHEGTEYTSSIYVDGLTKAKEYAVQLRKLRIRTRKVKGVKKDESNALIRLADCMAAVIREALYEKKTWSSNLFNTAKKKGFLIQV
jgi:hypothetical protein